jgi:hypothetical protein
MMMAKHRQKQILPDAGAPSGEETSCVIRYSTVQLSGEETSWILTEEVAQPITGAVSSGREKEAKIFLWNFRMFMQNAQCSTS